MGKGVTCVKVKIGQSSELDAVASILDDFAKSVAIYICAADDHDDISSLVVLAAAGTGILIAVMMLPRQLATKV